MQDAVLNFANVNSFNLQNTQGEKKTSKHKNLLETEAKREKNQGQHP